MEKEYWRPTINSPLYIVSTWGRVKNLRNGKLLKASINRTGHYIVSIHHKTIAVSRLMYEAFIRPLDKNEVVHHKDESPRNDTLSNFEVHTLSEHFSRHNRGRKPNAEVRKKMSISQKRRWKITKDLLRL